jgi:Mg-chelatase subunit ChlD
MDLDRTIGTTTSNAAGAFSVPFNGLEGPHLLTARAVNAAGQVSATSAPIRVTLDRTGPRIQITKPIDNARTRLDATPVYGTWEAENIDHIKVNGVQATLYDTSIRTQEVNGIEVDIQNGYFRIDRLPLPQNQNTLQAVATDTLQNQNSHQIQVIKDQTAPSITVTSPPLTGGEFQTRSDTVDISGLVNDPQASLDINGDTMVNTNGMFAATSLPLHLGENPFTITSRDDLGNKSATSFTVVYDPQMLHLDSISPLEDIPGNLVTIAGTGFSSLPQENQVTFTGATTIAAGVTPDGRFLKVVVPEDARTGPVFVTVAGQRSNEVFLQVPTIGWMEILPIRTEIRILGGESAFTAIARYSNSATRDISHLGTWSSQNPAIAMVDNQGKVTGHQEGQTQVNFRFGNVHMVAHVRVAIPQISVALVIDQSDSMNNPTHDPALNHAKQAARSLLHRMDPGDRACLIAYNDVISVHPFTSDPTSVENLINGVIAEKGTALYEAVRTAMHHSAAEQAAHPNNKTAILVLADGENNITSVSEQQAVDAILQYSDIEVYFAYIQSNSTGTNHLQILAQRTNSFYRPAATPGDLDAIFCEILNRAKDNPIALTVEPPAATLLGTGASVDFIARGRFWDGSVLDIMSSAEWTSANTGIATIDATGRATALRAGTSTIICVAGGIAAKAWVHANMPPVITYITPTQAVTGAQVNIIGRGFAADPSLNLITFNGVLAPIIACDSSTLLVQVPENATSGPVVVTVLNQRSNGWPFVILTSISSPHQVRAFPGNRNALVHWDKPSGPTTLAEYFVYHRSTTPAFQRANTSPTQENLLEVGGLTNNVPHIIRVHSVDTSSMESHFGNPTTVTPHEFYIEMDLDRIPTWGTTAVSRPDPNYTITVTDVQGQPLAGREIFLGSENNVFEFTPPSGVTDAQGRLQGNLWVSDTAGIMQDQLLKIFVFAGGLADAIKSGALSSNYIPRLTELETREHRFDGARMYFTNRIQGLGVYNPYASRPLTFRLLAVDANKELAMENFFIGRANGVDIPGYEVRSPMDSPEFREFLRQQARFENGAPAPMTAGSEGSISALDIGKIVGEILASIFIPGWDAVDLVCAAWDYFVDDESPSYVIVGLAAAGLAADVLSVTGVGFIGNVGIGVMKGIVKALDAINPRLVRWILSKPGDIGTLANMVLNKFPGGLGDQIGQVANIPQLQAAIVAMVGLIKNLEKIGPAGKQAWELVERLPFRVSDDATIGMAKLIRRSRDLARVEALARSFGPDVVNKVFKMVADHRRAIDANSTEGLMRMMKVFDDAGDLEEGVRNANRIFASIETFARINRDSHRGTQHLNDVLGLFSDLNRKFPNAQGYDELIKDLGSGATFKHVGTWTQMKVAEVLQPPNVVLEFEKRIPTSSGGHRIVDIITQEGPIERLVEVKSNYWRGIEKAYEKITTEAAKRRFLERRFRHTFDQAKDMVEHAVQNGKAYGIAFSYPIPPKLRPIFEQMFRQKTNMPSSWDASEWLSDGILFP